ncbi:MAG TPA: VWA domain-containing protein, partial [Thermoanaerobaculia bacterium]|nr:VWA domain-containing protein [Thermoanaerobaculia bacterium]
MSALRLRQFVVVLSTLIPVVTFAQQQQPPHAAETIDVTIRNVELVVSDRAGNRITGLPASEFQLYEDGTAHDISNFSEMRRAAAANVFQPAPRAILLAFDITSLTQAARRNAIDSAREFLAANLRTNDRVAIYAAGNTLTKVCDWTFDLPTLNKALDSVNVTASPSIAGGRETAQNRVLAQIRDAQQGDASGGGVYFDFRAMVTEARTFASQELRGAAQTVNFLSAALNAFGHTSAKKVMLIAGGGLPMRPGADLFALLENVRIRAEQGELGDGAKRGARQASPLTEAALFDLAPVAKAFAANAVRRGVAVYSLDPEMGERSSGRAEYASLNDSSADFSGVASRVAGYQFLAAETGGSAILGRRGADALSDMAKDLDSYYSVGYRTDAKEGDVPKVEVKSKTGYRVRATFAGVPPTRESEMEDRVVANHVEQVATNDLGIALATGPDSGGERRHVKLRILIPVKNLKLDKDGEFVIGGFDVYVATGDTAGNSSPVNRQTHQIKWP